MSEELQLYVFDNTKPIHLCKECDEFHKRYRRVEPDLAAAEAEMILCLWGGEMDGDEIVRHILDAAFPRGDGE